MSSKPTAAGSRATLPLIILAAVVAGGGWLWYESQPRPVAEMPPLVEAGPVTVRALDGAVSEVGGPDRGMALPRYDLPESPPSADAPTAAADGPVSVDAGRWEEEIARYEQADRVSPPVPGSVVLLGASNIRMWDSLAVDFAGLDVVNRGVGGCRLSELADFAPRLLAAARPGLIVVSAGSNDIHSGAEPEEVVAAFRKLLETVRRDHPAVPVLCLGILPAKSRWDEREQQERANSLLRAAIADVAAAPPTAAPVGFLDVSAEFLDAEGLPAAEAFLDDDLHPSVTGNARRAARMRPVVESLLEAARAGAGGA